MSNSTKIVVCRGSQFQYAPQVSFEKTAPLSVANTTKMIPRRADAALMASKRSAGRRR